jgi:hypothetical protein
LSDLLVLSSSCRHVLGEFGRLLECIIDQASFGDREKGIDAIIFPASFRKPGEFAGDPYGEWFMSLSPFVRSVFDLQNAFISSLVSDLFLLKRATKVVTVRLVS